MKKTLLAIAVLGAFTSAAHAQSSMTIYGIVDTGMVYQNKVSNGTGTGADAVGNKFSLNSGVVQGSRIGFKGVEDLGGGLNAVFNLEAGFNNDTGALQGTDAATPNNLFRRKAVVGLSGGFGSVLLGRQTDFADTLGKYTSVADFGGFAGSSGHGLSRLEGARVNNSISYTTNSIGGFTGNVLYGLGESSGKNSSGQSIGLGMKYDNGPLGLGLGYFQSKANGTGYSSDTRLIPGSATTPSVATRAGTEGLTAYKGWNLVGSYQIGDARVYGNWSRVKQGLNTQANLDAVGGPSLSILGNRTLARSSKADIFELGTAYSLTPSVKLLGAVQHTRAEFDGTTAKGRINRYNLGTDYWLSKRTDLYAFMSYAKATDMANPGVVNGTGIEGGQVAVAMGIRHRF